ncbi:hypothetical protein ACH5RR_002186 [Cinchona calisaya]|uniref:Uncharacterized protein n=1 Tax=Cinchona calisaya TaxID=153742 RepID=A0ABD3B648_9GENT
MAPPSILLGPPSIRHSPYVDDDGNPSPQSLSFTQKPKPQINPCMNLFFSNPSLPNLSQKLEISWNHNPLTTLRIIFNSRKYNKEAFFNAILWLHHNHPLSLACNISTFAIGSECFNDLLNILCTISDPFEGSEDFDQCRIQKKERDIARARNALEMYVNNAEYRFLHNQISSIFADLLRDDLQFYASGKVDKISCASKWCPSIDSKCDNSTLICESIARKLFPREYDAEYQEIDGAHYAYRVRNRLQKQVLVPLRRALNATTDLPTLQRTPKKAAHEKIFATYQQAYKRLLTADNDDNLQILLDMIPRSTRILPHNIVASLNNRSVTGDEVAELQWQSLVEGCAKKQKWKNCLAIFNISEDTRGAAVDFALGMGLLISELSGEPWKGKVLTFSTEPLFCRIEGGDLGSKIQFLRKKLKHGENLRVSNLFDQVLEAAVVGNVSVDMMVSQIHVFSDVEFEKATNKFWAVWASFFKYQSLGFKKLPEIVFWDVKDQSIGAPKASRKFNGLVTVKGFCDNWVKVWLKEGEFLMPEEMLNLVTRPEDFMKSALCRDELQNLIVFD